MRIAVCDDEALFRDKIVGYIEKSYKDIETVISSFSCGEELLKHYKNGQVNYDIIFLDIEMKELDGIKTAERIRNINEEVAIVFLTSHNEFAPAGYEVSAFRFLIKPVQENKLIEAIEGVKKQISNLKTLLVHQKDTDIILKIKNIIYIEAKNKEIHIHTIDNCYIERRNLNEIEAELKDEGFFRTHRGYLVNLSYVKEYDSKEVIVDNNEIILISRLKIKKFKESLYLHIKRTAK
ncbi:DNA-binding response regulator [Clostridium gelidum]|uniref:Stage 0 sporulation protein A homolog n=1 Tax=Clostridium gelidum TaxID=704125 RepID=A0ABM7T184_9CLOT|nr:LytTR family DNA-binding domain-containing protein [Clostridium gelidum]BCZ45392.1 DNA-binding response regulator [Clostridium gelidum]